MRVYRRGLTVRDLAELARLGDGVLCLPLDGPSPADLSSFAHPTTPHGAPGTTSGPNGTGTATFFDGQDDRIVLAAHEALRLSEESATIAAWIRPEPGCDGRIVAKGESPDWGLRIRDSPTALAGDNQTGGELP